MVGNEIGKGDIKEAKIYYSLTKKVSFGILALAIALTLITKDNLISIFIQTKSNNTG